jgi:hypothetical protein
LLKDEAADLWTMASMGTPMAIRVAATLGLADHVADGVGTAAELARVVKADPDALERLLRYLSVRGLLSREESGGYTLTALGEPLRDDHPSGVRRLLDIEGFGRGELAFVKLLHSVRTGEAAFPELYGHTLWEDLAADSRLAEAFNGSLGDDVAARSPGIVSGYDWGSLGHVVDVGGGNGSLLIALLTEYPSLRGTLVDLPGTAEAARPALAAAGLADRCDIAPGSFFDPLPPGAGGYVLSLVIHNWSDRDAGVILRRCAQAAGAGGSVFIVESIGTGGEGHTGMDLRMLVVCGGKARGTGEIASLAADSGLRLAEVHPAGPYSIVRLEVP